MDNKQLNKIAEEFGTPCYVYDFQAVLQMPFWWQSPPAVVDTTATVHHGQMPLDAPQQ